MWPKQPHQTLVFKSLKLKQMGPGFYMMEEGMVPRDLSLYFEPIRSLLPPDWDELPADEPALETPQVAEPNPLTTST